MVRGNQSQNYFFFKHILFMSFQRNEKKKRTLQDIVFLSFEKMSIPICSESRMYRLLLRKFIPNKSLCGAKNNDFNFNGTHFRDFFSYAICSRIDKITTKNDGKHTYTDADTHIHDACACVLSMASSRSRWKKYYAKLNIRTFFHTFPWNFVLRLLLYSNK